MTVCIAAAYRNRDGNFGIAIATDLQVTDSSTGIATETGRKLGWIGNNIWALGADDMVKFHDLLERVRDKVDRTPDPEAVKVADAARFYREAESEWRQEYIERHVLPKFGLTWDKYFDKLESDKFPEHFVRTVADATNSCETPYSTETIILGLEKPGEKYIPRIYRITPNAFDAMHASQGFAVIGNGELIADSEFRFARYNEFWPKHRALFMCFKAKTASEIIDGVGEATGLWVLDEKTIRSVDSYILGEFETEYRRLVSQREVDEEKAYERAKEAVEESANIEEFSG